MNQVAEQIQTKPIARKLSVQEYAGLDAKILQEIRLGFHHLGQLHFRIPGYGRLLRNRLQRLQELRKIRYAGQKEGWVLA